MQVAAQYPGDAAKGADFISASSAGEIVFGPDDVRPERVIITDLYLEHEGRVCIGERTVRHMANLLGMYEGERVDVIIAANQSLRAEIDNQAGEIDRQRADIARLTLAGERLQYVAPGGVSFTSLEAAEAYMAEVPDVVPVSDPLAGPTPGQVHAALDAFLDAELAELHDKVLDAVYDRAGVGRPTQADPVVTSLAGVAEPTELLGDAVIGTDALATASTEADPSGNVEATATTEAPDATDPSTEPDPGTEATATESVAVPADAAPEGDAVVEPATESPAPVVEVPDAEALALMPKPELAGLASDLELPGRSTMTADELRAALPEHAATLAAEPEAGA